MIVIVSEKPDIAKAITKVLPGSPKWQNGYIAQGNYAITWCYGHLLTLKDPEDYGSQYSRENTPNSVLPIFFNDWGLKVVEGGASLLKNGNKAPDKKAQLNTIGKLLSQASEVIIAGDIDDEGQLLVEEVLEWHNYKGPCKRLDTGALNEESLKKAMNNLMDNAPWHIRAVSARARSVSDFMLGINGSRFFSNTYGTNLSVGRVQTATLGLVVARDAQIEGHKALKHFVLDIDVEIDGYGSHKARFEPSENDTNLVDGKILDKKYLESIASCNATQPNSAVITKENVVETAPLPFSISALKSYCSDRFNISPEETLQITQSLRMNYGGLITYNRSECRYLPENMHSDAPAIIQTIMANLGAKWNFPGIDTNRKSKTFSDKNVGVHHAIIPTTTKVDISKLTENEKKVYKAICGFYVIQFMPSADKVRTRLTVTDKSGGKFVATSLEVVNKGFKTVLDTEKDNTTTLSAVPAGKYQCQLDNATILELETKPPKRYTDSSLETDMKNVAKYVTDPDAKKMLLLKDKDSKDEHGSIGTAATRSAIIATLKKRGFLKNEGKQVISTPLGREFYNILPDEIRKPDVTAKWWAIQQSIQDGEMTPNDMYNDVLSVFKQIASRNYPKINLSGLAPSSQSNVVEVGKCPRCGMPIIETKKAFGCSGYKSGCSFVLWKEGKYGAHKVLASSKKKLTTAMAKKILKNEPVTVRGLVSEKTGKSYDANIIMKDTGTGVFLELSFDNVPKKTTTKKK